MKNNFNKAFTLVELIVVITILAVLATVAFISFQGYSTESRDTKRKTDLATISKGLQVYLAANSLVPEPSETKTIITFSGSELLTQGYAGESVLNTLRVQEAQDPIDETFYTYSINANNTKFQLVGFLENTQTANNFLENKLFADNSNRNIYTIGESVGILFDETNTPIQELGNTTVELENNATEYKTVLNKQNIITESGSILKTQILGAQENLYGWRAFDPNCPIDDIQIGDQIWAGCNSTLGNGFEWGQADIDIGKDSYGGSVSSCFDYNGNNTATCTKGSKKMQSNAIAKDWNSSTNNNGDTEFNTIWGKLYTSENAINTACPVGWSIPSDEQWSKLEQYLGCNESESLRDGWGCDGLGWNSQNKSKQRALASKLFLPLSGLRFTDTNISINRGINTLLWSDSYSNSKLIIRNLSSSDSTIKRDYIDPNTGLSARCIKN